MVDWGEGRLFSRLQFSVDDAARAKLDEILQPFDTNTTWFFENIGKGLAADNCAAVGCGGFPATAKADGLLLHIAAVRPQPPFYLIRPKA